MMTIKKISLLNEIKELSQEGNLIVRFSISFKEIKLEEIKNEKGFYKFVASKSIDSFN